MPISQHFGTFIQDGFIKNEEDELVFFDQKLIVTGKAIKGDSVVYDLCQK